MPESSKRDRIEELLRRSLLGEELINTQFHLFSARSLSSGRVVKPRVLCANNALLAKSSNYFLDLLGSDISPSDPSLIELTDDHGVPSHAQIDEYGYGSDSDLDDCNDPIPITNPEIPKSRSVSKDDDELSDDGSESVSSDMFVMSPEQPREDDPFSGHNFGHNSGHKNGAGSVASSETAVHETAGNKSLENRTAIRLRSLESRHVLVKDTAFQTWYTLLNYLYTDNFSFLPLSSATPSGQPHESSTNSLDGPRCSAKSMYRLASKVGLDDLCDDAFSYIRRNLTERNILKELSCSLVSRHPELLEMELDVLYSHIASPSVVAEFPALARRIANKELPHGADIVVGIHTRFLRVPRPSPLEPQPRAPQPSASRGPKPAMVAVGQSPSLGDAPRANNGDDTEPVPTASAGIKVDSTTPSLGSLLGSPAVTSIAPRAPPSAKVGVPSPSGKEPTSASAPSFSTFPKSSGRKGRGIRLED